MQSSVWTVSWLCLCVFVSDYVKKTHCDGSDSLNIYERINICLNLNERALKDFLIFF